MLLAKPILGDVSTNRAYRYLWYLTVFITNDVFILRRCSKISILFLMGMSNVFLEFFRHMLDQVHIQGSVIQY